MGMERMVAPEPRSAKPWRSIALVGNFVFVLELVCFVLSMSAFVFFFTKTPLPDDCIIFSWLKPLAGVWSCSGMAKVGQTVGLTGIAFAWLISSASQEIAGVSMRELVKWAYPETYFCYFCTYFPMLIMLIYTGSVEESQPFSAVCTSFFASVGAMALLAYTLRISYVLLLSHEERRHIVLGFYIAKTAEDEKRRLIERLAYYWRTVKDWRRHIGAGRGAKGGNIAEETGSSSAVARMRTYAEERKQRRVAENAVKRQLAQQQRALWRRKGVQIASTIEVRHYPIYAEELAMLWHQNCADLETRIEALFAVLLQEQEHVDASHLMSLVGELATAWKILLRTQGSRADQTEAVRYILSARTWDETEAIFLCVALVDAIFQRVEEDEMSGQEAMALFRWIQPENTPDNVPITERQSQYLLSAFDMHLTAALILSADNDTEGEKSKRVVGGKKETAMRRTFEEWSEARAGYKYLKEIPEMPMYTAGKLLDQIVGDKAINQDTENELVAQAEKLEGNRAQLACDMNRPTITDADLAQIGWLLKKICPAICQVNVPEAEREASDIQESAVAELILKRLLITKGGFDTLIKVRKKEGREPEMVMLCTEMAFRQRHHIPYTKWQRAVNKRLLGDSNAASAMAQLLPRLWHRELCLQVWQLK